MSQVLYREFIVPSTVDDYTPVAALLDADFTKTVFLNGAAQGTAPTITEDPAGVYHYSYTFSTKGNWTIIISNTANTFRQVWTFDIMTLTIDDERPHAL